MPPSSQLVISKLGVQATASGETVSGLLCLKVSLPREGEGRQVSRYGLFSGNNPLKLTSPPEIHSLPLPTSTIPAPLMTASRLLGLGSSYPPPQASSSSGWKPMLDVSSTTGQVFLVLDPRRSSPTKRDGGGGRREWLILMRFEQAVGKCIERGSQQVVLSLPKCLDNVIRFQILSSPCGPSSEPAGEVSILTEPRILPVPASSFAEPSRPRRNTGKRLRRVGVDEGWEDGEDMGPDEEESEEEEGGGEIGGEGEGSWLEGRFQSTESLRLEWSFGGASTSKSLTVVPNWDPRHPTISVSFEAPITGHSVPIEAILPDGWGWTSLSIRGEGLVSWRSIDGDWWDESPVQEQLFDDSMATEVDDSFSTIRQRRNNLAPSTPGRSLTPSNERSAASLMRQPIPAGLGRVEDFSFEMSSNSIETAHMGSTTPVLQYTPIPRSGNPPGLVDPTQSMDRARRPVGGPANARLFDLVFTGTVGSFCFEGVLAPISKLTLVSPSLPTAFPFVRIDNADPHSQCELLGSFFSETWPGSRVNLSLPSIGTFRWTDGCASLLPRSGRIEGDVNVKMAKDTWGGVSQSIAFEWPKRAVEVGFSVPSGNVRIVRATKAGVALARAMVVTHDGSEVRLGLGHGASRQRSGDAVEIVLELCDEDRVGKEEGRIAIPQFDGKGQIYVELRGEWSLQQQRVTTNMTQLTPERFSHALSDPAPSLVISRKMSKTPRSRSLAQRLFSTRTMLNLFIVYLVISLAQQVQRLRNEVAYVVEEARDLRLYGMASSAAAGLTSTITTTETATTTATVSFGTITTNGYLGKDQPAGIGAESRKGQGDVVAIPREVRDVRTSLGRVVFGPSAWNKWAAHPTVQTLRRSLGWVWHAVVWLVMPT